MQIRRTASCGGLWIFGRSYRHYYQHKILQRYDHPRLQDLYKIEDPFYRLDRLTEPKFIDKAAGDQFFLPELIAFFIMTSCKVRSRFVTSPMPITA